VPEDLFRLLKGCRIWGGGPGGDCIEGVAGNVGEHEGKKLSRGGPPGKLSTLYLRQVFADCVELLNLIIPCSLATGSR